MKLTNIISLRVFCPPEENYEQIRKGFFFLLGIDESEIAEEKINYRESSAKGFSERKITVFEAALDKERHMNRFLKRLVSLVPEEDRKAVVAQTDRLDDEMNFFLRLDKKSVIDGKPFVTESGNCYHIKLSIAAFPKRKDVAHRVVRRIFLSSE